MEVCDEVLGGHCYKVHLESMTWYDARYTCLHDGGHLVTVCNEETNHVIKQVVQDQSEYFDYVILNDLKIHKIFFTNVVIQLNQFLEFAYSSFNFYSFDICNDYERIVQFII